MSKARLAGTVAAVAAAVALGCGTGTEAQAAAPTSPSAVSPQVTSCPAASGYACFWVNSYRGGTMGKVSGDNPDFRYVHNTSGCTEYPGSWNDCISSVENQGTQCTVFFYSDAQYLGTRHSLSIGDRVNDFSLPSSQGGYNDPNFNDAISSNSWC
ncbi:peptidase inhibitor family I36 protein [Streptomyces canus]|uniref:peptidase inhibitor family I36 protein n=1 Tax=Streptomyces canus TaxID=58343 RepID=UPI0036A4C123